MYAVVETGGKQYRVAPGQKVRVDRLEGELGSEVTLDRVLVVVDDVEGIALLFELVYFQSDTVLVDDNHKLTAGNPNVAGAVVSARIVEQHRERKVLVFKYAKRKRRRVKTGSRHYYTTLHIGEIRN